MLLLNKMTMEIHGKMKTSFVDVKKKKRKKKVLPYSVHQVSVKSMSFSVKISLIFSQFYSLSFCPMHAQNGAVKDERELDEHRRPQPSAAESIILKQHLGLTAMEVLKNQNPLQRMIEISPILLM